MIIPLLWRENERHATLVHSGATEAKIKGKNLLINGIYLEHHCRAV